MEGWRHQPGARLLVAASLSAATAAVASMVLHRLRQQQRHGKRPQRVRLTYFDTPARGEYIRLALHMSGINFEDITVTREEFAAMRQSLPFGQLPILEVDGHILSQSNAMLAWVAPFGDLLPNDQWQVAKAWEFIGGVDDMMRSLRLVHTEQDPVRKSEKAAAAARDVFPLFLARFSRLLGDDEWCAGGQCSIADLVLYVRLSYYFSYTGEFSKVVDRAGAPRGLLAEFPNLLRHNERVANHEGVRSWNRKRCSSPDS